MSDDRVHYARNRDIHLAYRIFGESGPTVIWVPGWVVSNVDTIDDPGVRTHTPSNASPNGLKASSGTDAAPVSQTPRPTCSPWTNASKIS
jgi:hypothetical protein